MIQNPVTASCSGNLQKYLLFSPSLPLYAVSPHDHQIDEKKRTMMAFFTSQQQTVPQQSSPQSSLKSTRKLSQPAMHIHAGGSGATNDVVQLRNPENVGPNTNRNIKRSSVTSISDEIIGDEDLQDVDAVFESLLTSTFSESESSTSVPVPKSGYYI